VQDLISDHLRQFDAISFNDRFRRLKRRAGTAMTALQLRSPRPFEALRLLSRRKTALSSAGAAES